MVLYGKASLRQILAFWLVLSQSGFCRMDWLKFYWDFKDWWRRRPFSERVQYYPEDLETFDVGITESQEAKDDFINRQKISNTNKKTATDMNTLLRYIEANGMKMRKLKAYLRPSLTTLSKFVLTQGGKTEKDKSQRQVSSFQPRISLQRYLEEISIEHIQRQWVRKIQKSPCSEPKVTCSDTSTAKETDLKLLRPSTKTKRMPLF